MNNKYYEFKNNNLTCQINNNQLVRHWYNYLWNEEGYCAQVSQMGHGSSFRIDNEANMNRLNKDGCRYIYLRDETLGDYFNLGVGPSCKEVEDYRCDHNIYSTIIRTYNKGIDSSWELFVPTKGTQEVWNLTVKNTSNDIKTINIFAVVNFELEGFAYPRYYEMYRACETYYDEKLNGVFCEGNHPFAPNDLYSGFIASSEKVVSYDGELSKFLGVLSTQTNLDASTSGLYQNPEVIRKGRDCTKSEGALFILGGVLQNRIELKPGEEKNIIYTYGVVKDLVSAQEVIAYYKQPQNVEEALTKVKDYYKGKDSTLTVQTPVEKINRIMNEWVKKQVDFCIVGKKGVRDNLQIAMGLLNYRVDKARMEILEVLKHQFQEGHCVLTWFPYDDTRYSDQPFWVVLAVIELIKETGDLSVLDELVPFQDEGEATVLEHMKRAIKCLKEDKGPNGLVRIRFADWNDALNISDDEYAESVMLSHQYCMVLKSFSTLCQHLGDNEYSNELSQEYEKMKVIINEKAWDGKWYKRAISKGRTIGGNESDGSKIYLNAQVWALMAEIVDQDRISNVLEAIDGMEQDFGFPINMPPYNKFDPMVGRMSGMLPGLFENGGVYCHASAFKMMMDCMYGRSEEALRTLLKLIPDSEYNSSMQSGAEPYVFTNCYSIHSKYYGRSYQSWTTGTSAWCLRGLYEGILGMQRTYEGLVIAPCFPKEWNEAKAQRRFRGTDYLISYKRIGKGDTIRILVDNQEIKTSVLPLFNDEKVHQVTVLIS